MVLYKPFLHHALKDVRRSGSLSLKAYACGSACIKAAMQVVWLAERLEACNLLNDAHWFTTLILAFTASCLALFVMSNKKDPTLSETSDAVRRIRELCSRYADRNASMQRCSKFLGVRHSKLQFLLDQADVRQSLPPSVESTCDDGTLDSWSRFTEDMSGTFSKAYGESDAAEGVDLSANGMLQALSLPFHFQSADQSYDVWEICNPKGHRGLKQWAATSSGSNFFPAPASDHSVCEWEVHGLAFITLSTSIPPRSERQLSMSAFSRHS